LVTVAIIAKQGDAMRHHGLSFTRVALDFAERTLVMDRGQMVYDGASETLQRDLVQLERLIGVRRA
jgi:hypothetical protein